MTQIHWTNPISDVFSNGADWSGGVVPGASDDAILDASGGAFTVTSSVSETVSSIQTAANATLAITGGAFTATGGTGAGVNAGLTSVVNGGTFSVGGVIDNAGTIEALGQIGQTSPEIAIGIGGGALSGGGTIALAAATGTGGNTGDAVLYGSTKASLTNIDNTIAGAGVIYVNSLLINGPRESSTPTARPEGV